MRNRSFGIRRRRMGSVLRAHAALLADLGQELVEPLRRIGRELSSANGNHVRGRRSINDSVQRIRKSPCRDGQHKLDQEERYNQLFADHDTHMDLHLTNTAPLTNGNNEEEELEWRYIDAMSCRPDLFPATPVA
jgi:hypothetical protein